MRLNEIKEKDYTDFRQLMDIALKNFPLKEKQKYIESVSKDYKTIWSIRPCYYSDNTSFTSSIESSGQLPYEIKFDGDDDFEQVLPKVVSWDVSTESECTFCFQAPLDSDFAPIDSVSHAIPNSIALTCKKMTKKGGLWAKAKKVFARLMCCRKQQNECKTSQTTDEKLNASFAEGNDWYRNVAEMSNSLLQTKGRL